MSAKRGQNPIKHPSAEIIHKLVDRMQEHNGLSPTVSLELTYEEQGALVWASLLLADYNAKFTINKR